MKKLLLPSIIAMLASLPAFADTVTTLPNNALCNETNLGTESGSADIEVVWEPNTINTQWFTGYGENTAAASATTCEYGGTINLPQTNPSRPGYAFAGWKLRTDPMCGLERVDTRITPDDYTGDYVRWKPLNGSSGFTMGNYGYGMTENSSDLTNGEWEVIFSYGAVKGVSSCQPWPADIVYLNTNLDSVMHGQMEPTTFLSEYIALAGPEKGAIAQQAFELYMAEDPDADVLVQKLQGFSTFRYITSGGTTGQICWCHITNYTTIGGSQCNISAPYWLPTFDFDNNEWNGSQSCVSTCSAVCAGVLADGGARGRALFYNPL